MSKALSEMTLAELWRLFPIQLSEHNPDWAVWYQEERDRLASILGASVSKIDHYGSTFVKGLIAKPTVDILLQIKANADMAAVKNVLVSDRWQVMDNFKHDKILLNKGYTPEGYADRVFHLHVRNEGDWDELYFRDYLTSHPTVAAAYAELKQRLLILYKHDRDAYTNAKTEFVEFHTAKAKAAQK